MGCPFVSATSSVIVHSLFRSSESKHGVPLGMVQIGQNVKDAEAKQLWEKVLGSPGQQNARWLHLLPCRVAPSLQRS